MRAPKWMLRRKDAQNASDADYGSRPQVPCQCGHKEVQHTMKDWNDEPCDVAGCECRNFKRQGESVESDQEMARR